MDQIIPLFVIASLDHYVYPSIKIRYLAGDPVLVGCDLLGFSGILSSKDIRHQVLGLHTYAPMVTAKRTYKVTAPTPPQNRNQVRPGPPTGTCPPTVYHFSRYFP